MVQRETLRNPTLNTLIAGIVAIFVVLGALNLHNSDLWLWVAGIVIALWMLRQRVIIDAEGITVVNPIRVTRARWEDVEGVRLGRLQNNIGLKLQIKGRKREVMALGGDDQRSRRRLDYPYLHQSPAGLAAGQRPTSCRGQRRTGASVMDPSERPALQSGCSTDNPQLLARAKSFAA